MKISMRSPLVLLFCFLLVPVSGAANPLVALPAGDFVCVVDVEQVDEPTVDPAAHTRPVQKKITITTSGKVRRDVILWSDGKTSELWWNRDKELALWEHNLADDQVLLLRGDLINPVCPKLLFLTEDSLSWIQEKTRTERGDGSSIHYEGVVVQEPATGERPASTARFQAWIDPETLLPLKLDDGNMLYTLKFSPRSPDDPMVMPPRIKEELDLWISASTPKAHR